MFDHQIESLWSRLGNECAQFGEGFNNEIGAPQLHVESNPDILLVRFTPTGAEVLFQLDRTQRHVGCWMTSSCADFGSCIVDQPPVDLTIQGDQLRFIYGSSAISEQDLAVKLLSDLVEFGAPAAKKSEGA